MMKIRLTLSRVGARLFAPAYLTWQGWALFVILATIVMGWWLINVPWYVHFNGREIGPVFRRIWEGSPADGVFFKDARIAFRSWLPSALGYLVLVFGLWILVRGGAQNMRLHRGLCWNCGYDRTSLARETKCPECGSPCDPEMVK